jgi:hypothetical protein
VSRQDFADQLRALGHDVEKLDDERIAFPFEIPVGKFVGTKIKLGFVVQGDFPLNPPASGPHLTPRLLPINTESKTHPEGGVHESQQFGAEWEYWSRPHNDWAQTDRSAKAYMAFIRLLFEKQ